MINEYKIILEDLKTFLIEGLNEGIIDYLYNGYSFDSTEITNLKYKFITKYEESSDMTDSNIIPILLITQPEQYFKGRILYNKQLIDLKTVLIKNQNIPKINFL